VWGGNVPAFGGKMVGGGGGECVGNT